MPARIGDLFLMECAASLSLKRMELLDCNLVRTFLGVSTLSDVVTADGLCIHPNIWKAVPSTDRQSRFQFARQEAPTRSQIAVWRRVLRTLGTPSDTTTPHLLASPLGAWISESNMIWSAMRFDSNLYRRDPTKNTGDRHIALHFPQHLVTTTGVSASATFYDSQPDWYTATIPALAIPTDLTGNSIYLASSATLQYVDIVAPASTFMDSLAQLPPAEYRLIKNVSFAECDAETVLAQYLQVLCVLYIGTDGGKKYCDGSFLWIIYSPGQEQLVLNSGPVDGWYRCQSSLRSEAAAISSVTLYLDEMASFYCLDRIHCRFQFYVDSSSAISNVEQLRDLIPKRKYPNNADIISTLKDSHHVLRCFTLTHVKSHQDDKVKFDDLPFSARLNVLCDRMATEQLKRQEVDSLERTQQCHLPTRNLPIEVFFGTQNIVSHYVKRLRDEITTRVHRQYLKKKFKWSDTIWDEIAWESIAICAT